MVNFYLKVETLEGGMLPTRGSKDSAGYDLYATKDGMIDPLQRSLIPLGIKTEFPSGWVGLILDRSGMGNKGITRFAGVVDSDYRGEWKVILFNSNGTQFGYKKGDRIAQVVFVPFGCCTPELGNLTDTERGTGGLGSTGN